MTTLQPAVRLASYFGGHISVEVDPVTGIPNAITSKAGAVALGGGGSLSLIPYDAANNVPPIFSATQPVAGTNFIVTNPGITLLPTPIDGITAVRQNDQLIYLAALNQTQRYTDPYAAPLAVAGPITLNNAHADLVLTFATTQVVTVNTGLDPGFNCTFVGPYTVAGTAPPVDKRVSVGSADVMSFMVNVGTDSYRLEGSKF